MNLNYLLKVTGYDLANSMMFAKDEQHNLYVVTMAANATSNINEDMMSLIPIGDMASVTGADKTHEDSGVSFLTAQAALTVKATLHTNYPLHEFGNSAPIF